MTALYVGLAVIAVCVLFGAANLVKAVFTVYTYTRQDNGTYERDYPGTEREAHKDAISLMETLKTEHPDKLVDIRRETWMKK